MADDRLWDYKDGSGVDKTASTTGIISLIADGTLTSLSSLRSAGGFSKWKEVSKTEFALYISPSSQPHCANAAQGVNDTATEPGATSEQPNPKRTPFGLTPLPSEKETETPPGRMLPFNVAPPIIVGIGALLVIASLFMPELASEDLARIVHNTVIESNPAVLLCVIAAVIAVVRYWNAGTRASARLAIGAGIWFCGWCVYDAFNSQLTRLNCDAKILGDLCKVDTSPGAGLWAAGVGCAVVALGGLMMRFPQNGFLLVSGPVVPAEEKALTPETKVCPRCAETIKIAARVCRYCGHEFEEPGSGTP